MGLFNEWRLLNALPGSLHASCKWSERVHNSRNWRKNCARCRKYVKCPPPPHTHTHFCRTPARTTAGAMRMLRRSVNCHGNATAVAQGMAVTTPHCSTVCKATKCLQPERRVRRATVLACRCQASPLVCANLRARDLGQRTWATAPCPRTSLEQSQWPQAKCQMSSSAR